MNSWERTPMRYANAPVMDEGSIEKDTPEFPEVVSETEVIGIDEAALVLGMSPAALYRRIDRSQIDDESDWIANEIYEDPRGRAA